MIITIKQNNKSSNLHYVRKGRTQNVRLEEAKREIDGRKKKRVTKRHSSRALFPRQHTQLEYCSDT